MSLAWLVALPFVASVVSALMPAKARTTAATWAALVALACAVQMALLWPAVRDGGVVREAYAWLPAAGLEVVWRVDGFAWMFAMLVTGIGALVALYARYYMSPDDPVPRFFSLFLAFLGSMLALVLSGNLVQLVVFWEATSLVSFLLIGYWYHRADARRGARMSLAVTGAGGLCLLAGVLLIGHVVGSHDLDAVLAAGERLRADPLYPAALLLVLAGALTKSAQFPFHFWLPHAMAAPTPVSAYLHSATMVKAGVFLLARLWPALAGSELWFWIVTGAGATTLVLGAYAAMFQHDLKRLLAYSTISHLGLITLLLGLNSRLAAVAAVFHIINHATFKASLFMAAGIIDHETGTRDTRRLDGLIHAMPITVTLALVASAAMAGVPLLNGFLSKEMFFAETVFIAAHPVLEKLLPVVATVAGTFAVVYALRFSVDIAFGTPSTDLPRTPHEPARWMRWPVEILVLVCLIVGIAPAWAIGPVLAAAARPVVVTLPAYDLAVWHGLSAPLAMSVIALVAGTIGYRVFRRRLEQGDTLGVPLIGRLDGRRMFAAVLSGVERLARGVTRIASTRRLQTQVLALFAVPLAAALAAVLGYAFEWGDRPRVPATLDFILLWGIGCACAIGAAVQARSHRLAALTLLGGAGLATCLTYAWFSAPDLALTQLAVEVVTTVLFLLGLRWLPKQVVRPDYKRSLRMHARRGRDFAFAIAAGAATAALAYAMLTRRQPQSIAEYYLSNALPAGGGTNVVNVMLVDFRSFDTMGEITVLGAVALAVYALLRRFRPPRESAELPSQQRGLPADLASDLVHPRGAGDVAQGYLLVPGVLARLMLPIAGLLVVHLFLRGHNLPGGGFVAGLVVAIALLAQYLVAGTLWVEARMNPHPIRWIAAGLIAVVATGSGALVLGYPFLTTHTAHLTLPLLGEVHLPSAIAFDLGVFAAVVGATLALLIALGHQSIRAVRRAAESEPRAEAGG
jgi:multicomponent K+:H+ antiporter subunit A